MMKSISDGENENQHPVPENRKRQRNPADGISEQPGHPVTHKRDWQRRSRSIIRSESGQATVELALSLVVLLLIVFAIIDFGRIFQVYLTTNHATREGARIASLGATDTEITTATSTAAQVDEVTNLTVTITPPQELRKRGTFVTVTTTYPVTISVPLMDMVLPNPFTVKSKTVMRVE